MSADSDYLLLQDMIQVLLNFMVSIPFIIYFNYFFVCSIAPKIHFCSIWHYTYYIGNLTATLGVRIACRGKHKCKSE